MIIINNKKILKHVLYEYDSQKIFKKYMFSIVYFLIMITKRVTISAILKMKIVL